MKRNVKNIFASAAGYAIVIVINIIATPILVQNLTAEEYGLQNFVNIIVGYFLVLDLGIELPIIKHIAEDLVSGAVDDVHDCAETLFWVYTIIGLIGLTLVASLSGQIVQYLENSQRIRNSDGITIIILCGFGFLGNMVISWSRAVCMGYQRYEYAHGINAMATLLSISLGLLVVAKTQSLIAYICVRVCILLLACVPILLFLQRHVLKYNLQIKISMPVLKKVRPYLGYGVINRVIGMLVNRYDQTVIALCLSVAVSGYYSIAFQGVNAVGYGIAYALGFTLPLVSTLKISNSNDDLRETFKISIKICAILSIAAYVPLAIFAEVILKLWLKNYDPITLKIFQILSIYGLLGSIFATIPNNVVNGLGRIRQFTIYATLRNVWIVIACTIAVKAFGAVGVAWAMVLTVTFDIGIFAYASKSCLQLPVFVTLCNCALPPLCVGIVLGFAFSKIPIYGTIWYSLPIYIFLYILIFIVLCFAIKIISKREIVALLHGNKAL